MAISQKQDRWDAVAEQTKWREAVESESHVQNQVGDQLSKSSPPFNLLCLAELDAGSQLLHPEYFASRATFVAQLRRLIASPTQPSRPVPSLQAYKDSQKWWLESMIQVYEHDS
jgi:hypothetical protein